MHKAAGPLRHAGFSLVELMIAMVLGLIVVAGLIQVLTANRKAYQVQQGTNYLQQNMRFASERIAWSLRMADFWGGNKPDIITGTPAVTATGSCDQAWMMDAKNAVYGYDGGTSFPITGCVPAANYVKGSDVLVTRYADADALNPAASSTISAQPKQVYLVSAVGQQAAFFVGSDVVPTTPAAAAIGRYVYPYHLDMYYLRPCSDPSGGTNTSQCDAADDNGSPIPTLVRARLASDGTLTSEALVEGIEQLQFTYGINGTDPDPTKAVPSTPYKSATSIAADEWHRVITVRLGLVAVGQQRDVAIPHPMTFSMGDCTYAINDGSTTVTGCPSFTAPANKPWQFVRSQLAQVIQVRNRTRLLNQ